MERSCAKWRVLLCLVGALALFVASGCAVDRQTVKHAVLPDPVGPDIEEDVICEECQPELPEGYILPVEHASLRISCPFGARRGGGRHHRGMDMEVPEGTPVVASQNGITSFSGTDGAFGDIIIIAHEDGSETAYAHLKTRFVTENDPVRQGQVIALVGRTGNATAYHLHFEIRKNGVPVDPYPWLPLAAAK